MKLNICGTSDFSVHHGRRSARRNAMAPGHRQARLAHCGAARRTRDGADSQAAVLGAHAGGAAAADASPALPGSVPERCPLRCRLSARRRVASPPHAATQGWTVPQLPSGGGRYFIYRPPRGQAWAVGSAADGHDTPLEPSERVSSPRPPRRGAASPA